MDGGDIFAQVADLLGDGCAEGVIGVLGANVDAVDHAGDFRGKDDRWRELGIKCNPDVIGTGSRRERREEGAFGSSRVSLRAARFNVCLESQRTVDLAMMDKEE